MTIQSPIRELHQNTEQRNETDRSKNLNVRAFEETRGSASADTRSGTIHAMYNQPISSPRRSPKNTE